MGIRMLKTCEEKQRFGHQNSDRTLFQKLDYEITAVYAREINRVLAKSRTYHMNAWENDNIGRDLAKPRLR